MYALVEFAFKTPESFARFFTMDTVPGAERCFLTQHVLCENAQLHPVLFEKERESLLGVNGAGEGITVILNDIDDCYEANCEDNDQIEDVEDMETTESNAKYDDGASGSFPYWD